MSFYNRNTEKKRVAHDFERQDEDVVRGLCRMDSRSISPRSAQEEDKRIRREIANSNERRRMQSINAGFQYLRSLLPQGEEKLSKASILQQTADYIFRLEHEKTMLLEQNCQLKRAVMNSPNSQDSDSDSPYAKRKKLDAGDLSDEGLGNSSPANDNIEEMRREIKELMFALECEKKVRMHLEVKVKQLEAHRHILDKTCDVALQDHISYHATENSRRHRSPKSLSTNEIESFHEVPDSAEHEVPEDLSGRRSSTFYSSKEVSNSNINPSRHTSPPAFTVNLEISSPKEAYRHSTSRQNLATIVEAIRHLEGDHMFRDDPPKSPISHLNSSEDETQFDQICQPQNSDTSQDFTLQHKIIRNAPISQSRPGVIVSKLS